MPPVRKVGAPTSVCNATGRLSDRELACSTHLSRTIPARPLRPLSGLCKQHRNGDPLGVTDSPPENQQCDLTPPKGHVDGSPPAADEAPRRVLSCSTSGQPRTPITTASVAPRWNANGGRISRVALAVSTCAGSPVADSLRTSLKGLGFAHAILCPSFARLLARPEGFEPPTNGFEGRTSRFQRVAALRNLSQLLGMRRARIPGIRRFSHRSLRILRTGCGRC